MAVYLLIISILGEKERGGGRKQVRGDYGGDGNSSGSSQSRNSHARAST